jgi:Domain of unknown function (DUF222)/HNH endonuclease
MLAVLTAACEALDGAIAGTDPALLSGVDCAQVVELLARTEKKSAALRVLAAARAADCGAHKTRGFSNPAQWLADTSGLTTGEAHTALNTAKALDDCPETKQALLAGQLSLTQASEITKTVAVVPGSESRLLDLAATSSVGALKDEARRQRLEAQDADERHRRQRQDRHFRHWIDEQGMIRLSGALSPEIGVPVINRIDTETDRLVRDARADDNPEPRERLAADALAKLILQGGQPKARSAELVLVCDIGAFQRGHAQPGEVCHVIGGGPVPVSVAVELATAAFIKAVLHNGVAIETVAHFGRYLSTELRTALGLGDPPLFNGAMCVDCGRRYGLEWDHVNPVNNRGPTSYDNLRARCWPCHREKTERDRRAGLLKPRPADPTPPDPAPQTRPAAPTSAPSAAALVPAGSPLPAASPTFPTCPASPASSPSPTFPASPKSPASSPSSASASAASPEHPEHAEHPDDPEHPKHPKRRHPDHPDHPEYPEHAEHPDCSDEGETASAA